jgi:hypothetical protein
VCAVTRVVIIMKLTQLPKSPPDDDDNSRLKQINLLKRDGT